MIQFKDVSFTYGAYEGQLPVPAVDHVSFHIRKGSHVALLGRNGSGKSTIARLMNGLLLPDEGEVFVSGMNTADAHDIVEIRRRCGMVFQNPDNQLIGATVGDDAAFGPCNLGLPVGEVKSRVEESLKRAGLYEMRDRAPSDLSGGQKQKLAIASILAMKPDCIILDEATSMLDPVARREVMALILELKNKHGISIVQITHHMEEAVLADYIYVISDGRVALHGTPADVFDQADRVRAEGLAVPTHIEIAHRIAKAAGAAYHPDEIFTFEGAVAFTRHALRLIEDDQGAMGRAAALSSAGEKSEDSCHVSLSGQGAGCLREEKTDCSAGPAAHCEPVIEVENLSYTYDTHTGEPVAALTDVSLTVGRGEILGIVGHTGSGKSTLIQHMNGIIPSKKNTVRVLGRDLSERRTVRDIRRHVGLLFQYPEDQLFEETVALDIAFAPKQLERNPEEVEKAVLRAARRLGVESVLQRSPFELSGGQRRRVAIAGVLAAEPDIIILDEPAAGLDPAGQDELFADLLTLTSEGATLLIVSHDMETMARLCHRMIVMKDGRVAGDGSPNEITASAEFLESVSLSMPPSKSFLNCFTDRYPALDTSCFTAADAAVKLLLAAGGAAKADEPPAAPPGEVSNGKDKTHARAEFPLNRRTRQP